VKEDYPGKHGDQGDKIGEHNRSGNRQVGIGVIDKKKGHHRGENAQIE